MTHYDVFNGDADGICALHQLRLNDPQPASHLITGVKRDIKLLAKLESVTDSTITVLDISLDRNREDLNRLITTNNKITYIDHHFSGDLPKSPLFIGHINPAHNICTSLIVDDLLDGRYRKWAICGAFGDNLHSSAHKTADTLSLPKETINNLRELGELLNYNGYGDTVSDLHFPPDVLFRSLKDFSNPLDFFSSPTVKQLREGFKQDLAFALEQNVIDKTQKNKVFHFPNHPWAKRIVGVFSNLKARENPEIAHAIMIDNNDSTLRISIRAPLNNPKDADTLCRKFPTGGGRSGAAGVNNLPPEMTDDFLTAFYTIFS